MCEEEWGDGLGGGVCRGVVGQEGEERTLFTRIVPAKPLRPAMPRGGGNAQSSPTITICKCKEYHHYFNILSYLSINFKNIPLLYNLQILLVRQPNQNLNDHQYNSVNIQIAKM